jgi:hypothetical protein
MTLAKRVLIVDDDRLIQKRWRRELGTSMRVVSAFTPMEAKKLFDLSRLEGQELNGSDFGVIVIGDTLLREARKNLLDLIYFKQHFSGKMIGAADRYDDQIELIKAGCDVRVRKAEVPEAIFDLFGMLMKAPENEDELPLYEELYDAQ